MTQEKFSHLKRSMESGLCIYHLGIWLKNKDPGFLFVLCEYVWFPHPSTYTSTHWNSYLGEIKPAASEHFLRDGLSMLGYLLSGKTHARSF